MLTITIPKTELYNDETEEFINIPETKLQLEHSLVSISKWESKWHKAFLGKEKKTDEMTLDYIRCMTVTGNVDPNVYLGLTDTIVKQIVDYIDDPMSATCFHDDNKQQPSGSKDVMTSELIYYYMFSSNIPMSCEKWHLNRLLKLIKVFSVKNSKPKKMSHKDIAARNRALNEANRKRFNTLG